MSIRPVRFNSDGSIEAWHDERGHGGVVPAGQITWTSKPDGKSNYNYIQLPCPVPGCGSVSTHPVGGGAAPDEVQPLFAIKYQADKDHPAQSADEALAAVNVAVAAMDGPGRVKYQAVAKLAAEKADVAGVLQKADEKAVAEGRIAVKGAPGWVGKDVLGAATAEFGLEGKPVEVIKPGGIVEIIK